MQPQQGNQPIAWRLLITPPANGAWNMAVDEAILMGIGAQTSPATIRLYAWQPPCLSLGYAQSIEDIDLSRLRAFGWDLVRRPTGGRAILHTDELTYSVIAPHANSFVSGSILESYKRISQALLRALQLLELPAIADPRYDLPTGAHPTDPVCFEVPSNFEITVNGKKLIGSAQARKKEGVLQHGALPLTGDLSRITKVLRYPDETARSLAAQRLLERATTVETALGSSITWQQAAEAFKQAFEQLLQTRLTPGNLSEWEEEQTRILIDEKYANPNWVQRH